MKYGAENSEAVLKIESQLNTMREELRKEFGDEEVRSR
jgi:hypothetical protein